MISNNDRTILRDVCFKVFEQLAFMFGEELEEGGIECDADKYLRASMEFNGPQQGKIELVVPGTIPAVMAANILGLDDDQPVYEDTAVDALKELLNTIAGRFMTSSYGEDAIINLTIPETEELDREQWEELVNSNQYLALTIEDDPILITIIS